jgi:hypothetical protein
MSREPLRFTIRLAQSDPDLRSACGVRSVSYGRHMPNVTSLWSEPDALDRDPATAVFVAFAKSGGEPIGTIRLTTNARQPTQIEQSVTMPDGIADRPIAELTRFAVLAGVADPAVKLGLMKAIYLYSLANQIQWMVIGARSEALVRQYRRLGFTDIADGRCVELPYAGNLPHRILAFDVKSAERNWFALHHPFYDFMVRSYHADIQPFGAPAPRVANA